MADPHVRHLPDTFADELARWAPEVLTDDEVYRLARLAERIHADGYDAGHRRGYREGRDHGRRPNTNQVNQLREAIAAEAKETGHG